MEYRNMTANEHKLVGFIIDRKNRWKEHRDGNYLEKWREYERLWRGIFAEEDRTKQSERAKIVSPALQQAIEARQAELEEAVFGNGKEWFDIEDDQRDEQKEDVIILKKALQEAFKKDRVKKYVSQGLTLGEVFGTGVLELQVLKKTDINPATQPTGVEGLSAVGVTTSERVAVVPRPIVPYNFIIDPNALEIEDAFGVAVEEFVSVHTLIKGMEDGLYEKVKLCDAVADDDLERSQEQQNFQDGKALVLRYYGLIPASLLDEEEEKDEVEKATTYEDDEYDGEEDMEEYSDLVEGIVVIANDGVLLKAEKSPYMMQDRPFAVYRPEIIPGRFWGRGTAEKGYNMQKALDGQVRAHLDSVALTAAPMMGIDATRMPRGFKFEVRAGKSILTNGNPADVLMPLRFGETTPVNVETANLLERMLQQATGTIDSAGLPQTVGQQSDPGAMAMALSGLIKKNKRSLLNFQEDFLIPLVEKAAWRYMQFDPDNFPVKDFKFLPLSTMGIMAREYEQQQFIGLLQTLGPDSPIAALITKGIVQNSSLSNKDELVLAIEQLAQPNPEQQQQEVQAMELQNRLAQAEVAKKEGEAAKVNAEAQAVPMLAQAKYIAALSNNLDDDNEAKDFANRAKIAELQLKEFDLMLKKADIESNERIAALQTTSKNAEVQTKAIVERMKVERDKDGNLNVTKTKE